MRRPFVCCMALVCAGSVGIAEVDQVTRQDPPDFPDKLIQVRLKGHLWTYLSFEDEATSIAHIQQRFDEVPSAALKVATVQAGGTAIRLDWSRSDAICRELIWWSVPHAGDWREPHAEVTGTMVFKPLKDLSPNVQFGQTHVSGDTLVPVVIVESIEVYLADYNGRRKGRLPHRERVVAEDVD